MSPHASFLSIASRVAASLIGGWILVWGFVTLGIVLLVMAGMSYVDARTTTYLLAFLVFLAAFCWSFATRSATRAWLVQVALGATMTALGWWIVRAG